MKPTETLPVIGPRTAVVDADGLVYRSLAGTTIIWDGEPVADMEAAHKKFKEDLDAWCADTGTTDRVLCMTHSGRTHRYKIYPDYKGNRSDDQRPMGFHDFRAEVIEKYKPVVLWGLEADDACGLLASYREAEGIVVVSPDKDMLTLPGIRWKRPGGDYKVVSKPEADLNWLRQGLSGDPVDNYYGIPKVGPRKAARILPEEANVAVLWEKYLRTYEHMGLTEEAAVVQALLARILRPEDYSLAESRVVWEPGERVEDISGYPAWFPNKPVSN